MEYTCPNPGGSGPGQTIELNSVSGNGNTQSQNPTMGAERLNLCFADVQQTIAEGRAAGIPVFNISGSTLMKN